MSRILLLTTILLVYAQKSAAQDFDLYSVEAFQVERIRPVEQSDFQTPSAQLLISFAVISSEASICPPISRPLGRTPLRYDIVWKPQKDSSGRQFVLSPVVPVVSCSPPNLLSIMVPEDDWPLLKSAQNSRALELHRTSRHEPTKKRADQTKMLELLSGTSAQSR
jgi:hypothetical protein